MSWWTEIFLAATSLDDNSSSSESELYPAIEKINKWLADNSNSQLFQVKPANDWQHSPIACFAGYFKGLDHDGFINAVKLAPWAWREQVQLFIRQEDDNGFRETNLLE